MLPTGRIWISRQFWWFAYVFAAKNPLFATFSVQWCEKLDGRDEFILETSVSAGSHTKVTIRSST